MTAAASRENKGAPLNYDCWKQVFLRKPVDRIGSKIQIRILIIISISFHNVKVRVHLINNTDNSVLCINFLI